jgi:hypothetical protein
MKTSKNQSQNQIHFTQKLEYYFKFESQVKQSVKPLKYMPGFNFAHFSQN